MDIPLSGIAGTDYSQGIVTAEGTMDTRRLEQWVTQALSPSSSTVVATDSTTARTLANRFAERVNVKDYGAFGDGVTDDTAAILAAITVASSSNSKSYVFFPPGNYISDSIVLDSIRCLSFIGCGGEDDLTSKSRTVLTWKAASSGTSFLSIKSSAYLAFEDITFYGGSNSGKDSLIIFQCNASTTTAPRNKFASTQVSFRRCGFLVGAANSCTTATINQKSTIMVDYEKCNFSGANAIKIGKDTDVDPITGGATVPDGRTVLTTFTNCIFRGNIVRERILNVAYYNCYFGANSVSYNGTDYRISMLLTSGNEEIRNELIDSCESDVDGVTNLPSVWCAGAVSPPADVEPNLTIRNSFLGGAGTIADIYSGTAEITQNRFVAQNKPGVATWIGVRVNAGAGKVVVDNNDFDGWLNRNIATVVAYAVTDTRTFPEDDKYLIARTKPTDQTLTNNSFTSILSRTVDHLYGCWCECSYQVTFTTAIDSTFTARLTLDGVAIPGTSARFTTNTTAAKVCNLVLPTSLVYLSPTLIGSNNILALEIQQSAGATFAVIRSDTYALGTTQAYIKAVC